MALFYLPAPDGSRLVAVGQRQKLRHEVVIKVIEGQLLPWLLGLPVLLLLILWAVRKGLRPLQQVAGELGQRSALDSTPLSENVPGEVLPMVRHSMRCLPALPRHGARTALYRRCRA
jgi:two-component system sensor histidine kinase QseC